MLVILGDLALTQRSDAKQPGLHIMTLTITLAMMWHQIGPAHRPDPCHIQRSSLPGILGIFAL